VELPVTCKHDLSRIPEQCGCTGTLGSTLLDGHLHCVNWNLLNDPVIQSLLGRLSQLMWTWSR